MMTDSKNTLILWGADASPYVRKVKVALLEKNLAFEQHQTLPVALLKIIGQAIPNGLTEASPLGKIPALEDGAVKVADSAVIMAYLDKQYTTGTALYPSQASAYAGVRWFEFICAKRGLDPVPTFHRLVAERFKGRLKAPFNEAARAEAEFPARYYQPLANP